MDREKTYEAAVKAFYQNARFDYSKETYAIRPAVPLKSIGIILGSGFIIAIILAVILGDFCIATILILGALGLAYWWGYKETREKFLTDEELDMIQRNYLQQGDSASSVQGSA